MSTFKIDSDEHFIVTPANRRKIELSKRLLAQPLSERKRWADALRSGKYKQSRTVMCSRSTKGYCCLGVWESINGVSDEVLWECAIPVDLGDNRHKLGDIYPEDIDIPVEYGVYGQALLHGTCFAELNDSGGATFEQIAALIHPEGVTDWKALQ